MNDDGVDKTLGKRLDHLFKVQGARVGREPTYREVATTIANQGGPTVSPSYLWQLRTGLKNNPTLGHLQALAGYFKVEPAYFFDADVAERVDADNALVAAMRDPAVREVALAANQLSARSLAMVRSVLERTVELEQNAARRTRESQQMDPPSYVSDLTSD